MTTVPVRRLEVHRRLSGGDRVRAGVLASSGDGATYFEYDTEYRSRYPSLSPFSLQADGGLHRAPATPHGGLHGVFADSLPDGWGMLLMDRAFRRRGVLPHRLTPLDRLGYVGERGMGALEYTPALDQADVDEGEVDVGALGDIVRCCVAFRRSARSSSRGRCSTCSR